MPVEKIPHRYVVFHLYVYKGTLAWVQAQDIRASSKAVAQQAAEDSGPSNIARVYRVKSDNPLPALLSAQRECSPMPLITRIIQ